MRMQFIAFYRHQQILCVFAMKSPDEQVPRVGKSHKFRSLHGSAQGL